MEKIEITTTKISLSEIVRQVARDRVSLELSEGHIPLARIVPIDREHSLADLDGALREIPRLGEDSEVFERDVLALPQSFGELDDPWES